MPKQKENVQKVDSEKWIELIKHVSLTIGYGSLFFFLVINILFSQQLPDLYFSLAREKKESMVQFLKQFRKTSSFTLLFPEIKTIFASHEDEIYAEEKQRKELIQSLEILLKQNPQSRDVLYSLYLLYDKNGDIQTAQMYLQRAKEVDPGIGS